LDNLICVEILSKLLRRNFDDKFIGILEKLLQNFNFEKKNLFVLENFLGYFFGILTE